MNPFKWTATAFAAAAFSALAIGPPALADDHRRGYRDQDNRHLQQADRRYEQHNRDADYRRDRNYRSDHRYDQSHHYSRRQHVYGNHRSHHNYSRRYRDHRYDWNHYWRGYDGHYNRHGWKRYQPRVYYHPRVYKQRHHYKPRWRVGGRYGYSRHSVVVHDYGRHGLYAPPRGHHWVRDNDRGDAILASVATGAIIGLAVGVLAYD